MARYIYHGPPQAISLAVGHTKSDDGEKCSKFRDVQLATGQETPDLPDDNVIVKSLTARGLLEPVAAKPGGRTSKDETKTEGAKS